MVSKIRPQDVSVSQGEKETVEEYTRKYSDTTGEKPIYAVEHAVSALTLFRGSY